MLAERRCFCNNCKTEFRFPAGAWDDENCPVCGNNAPDYELIGIPDYETPAQYEKRTGKAFPSGGLVWYRIRWANGTWHSWQIHQWHKSIKGSKDEQYVIADPPVPPPDDWRPE